MEVKESPSLEIDDDPKQQQREWIMQRIALMALTALLIAVALGLFGRGGPLSSMTAISDDGALQLEYERFVRHHSPDTLQLTVKAQSDAVRLQMDSEYAKHVQIERITPDPAREIGEDGAVVYVFNTHRKATVSVSFHFSPQKYGRLEGWIALAGSPRLHFSHFVYP
ncbi:MAG TPA: hypothetical protein VEC01_00725 [Noviherbaspirillum sp.]|uniref:hypothetical protein n=1 Tax=Noviherbaspirillum sp. TaxID=1926288 RepID=UPI002D485082|nr:hypothetical protein [Noviherbaspirillum sp.]HYD93816.1 hypothetical protein [Noviherbaspirillum sp.]